VGIFFGIWEFCWWRGYADPLMLPPPHLFLANLTEQFKFFDPAGARSLEEEGGGFVSVLIVMGWTSMRVILGLAVGFIGAVAVGVGIGSVRIFVFEARGVGLIHAVVRLWLTCWPFKAKGTLST